MNRLVVMSCHAECSDSPRNEKGQEKRDLVESLPADVRPKCFHYPSCRQQRRGRFRHDGKVIHDRGESCGIQKFFRAHHPEKEINPYKYQDAHQDEDIPEPPDRKGPHEGLHNEDRGRGGHNKEA